MLKAALKRAHMLGVTPGFVAVSQGVAVELVERCCSPTLTGAEYDQLVEDAAKAGFRLTNK